MAGKRREGRILAAQFLYQWEVGVKGIALDEALKNLWVQTEAEGGVREFAEKRIRAVIEKQAEVDAELKKLVTNWEPGRMAPVDRAILRLALWEMKFADDARDGGADFASFVGSKDGEAGEGAMFGKVESRKRGG